MSVTSCVLAGLASGANCGGDGTNRGGQGVDANPALQRFLDQAAAGLGAGTDPEIVRTEVYAAALADPSVTATAFDPVAGIVGIEFEGGERHLLQIGEAPEENAELAELLLLDSNGPVELTSSPSPEDSAALFAVDDEQSADYVWHAARLTQGAPGVLNTTWVAPGAAGVALLSPSGTLNTILERQLDQLNYEVSPGARGDFMSVRAIVAALSAPDTAVFHWLPRRSGVITWVSKVEGILGESTWIETSDFRESLPDQFADDLLDGRLKELSRITGQTEGGALSRPICITTGFLAAHVTQRWPDHSLFFFNGASGRDLANWVHRRTSYSAELITWTGSADFWTRARVAAHFFQYCSGDDRGFGVGTQALVSKPSVARLNAANETALNMLQLRGMTSAPSGAFLVSRIDQLLGDSESITLAPSIYEARFLDHQKTARFAGPLPPGTKIRSLVSDLPGSETSNCTAEGYACVTIPNLDTSKISASDGRLVPELTLADGREISGVPIQMLEWDLTLTKSSGFGDEEYTLYVAAFPQGQTHWFNDFQDPGAKLLGFVFDVSAKPDWEYESPNGTICELEDSLSIQLKDFCQSACGAIASVGGSTGTVGLGPIPEFLRFDSCGVSWVPQAGATIEFEEDEWTIKFSLSVTPNDTTVVARTPARHAQRRSETAR